MWGVIFDPAFNGVDVLAVIAALVGIHYLTRPSITRRK